MLGWFGALLVLAFVAAGLVVPATAAGPGAISAEGSPFRRQAWLLPSPAGGLMQALLFRPAGDGPFPVAIVNHGSDEDAGVRSRQKLPEFPGLTAYLVGRGYAVLLPLRPGHGATGGRYLEGQGWCGLADFRAAGLGTARSITAALEYIRTQDFITSGGALIVGNSAGGWGALAFASTRPAGVAGIVNFAGGRGGRDGNRPNNNCSPDRLVAAAAEFGGSARLPSLWLYSENDTYFPPELSQRLAAAYGGAGGPAEYHLLPPVRGDGHALISTEGREASWRPYLAKFLDRLK